MADRSFVLRGDVCHSRGPTELHTVPNGYLVCEDALSRGVFVSLPERFAGLPLFDHPGKLILPGLCDLHMHAPQYAFRALGMDCRLLEWLNTRTFPEEAKYADLAYAEQAYAQLVRELTRGPNTRICLFATPHVAATIRLMELLEESGLVTMVGKVNMDRNAPDPLRETDAAASIADTLRWLDAVDGRFANTRPILTPRFIPSCTDDLMRRLAAVRRKRNLPVQSHLSENRDEVAWVAELCPGSAGYGHAYADFDMFGGDAPTVMAHCVWSGEEETELMRRRGVVVAHCPQSNANLSSGIAPARRFLDRGLRMGLGSDMAGGCHSSIFRAMADAIQVSKLRWALCDQDEPALTLEEAFWLGTAGGGAFFGKVGSFDDGYEFDALVMDDALLAAPFEMTIPERLARVVHLSDDRHIAEKYVRGRLVR
jgi:guanine deaminase